MEGKKYQFILTFMINVLLSSMKITHNLQYRISVNLNPLC